MISWIQTRFKRHTKVALAFLLVAVALPFVFSINGGALSWWTKDSGHRARDFFGYDIASQPTMRRLTQDVRLSAMLQLGYLMPAAGARYERDALRRAACLALAKRHGIVRATEERIRQRITELRLFADEHGTFDPRRYELFREQLRADNEFKEADIVRVIGDDLRIGQVEGLLAGPGYVVPAEIEHGMTFSTTQWFLQAAVFATDDLPPLSEPGELVLADYFGKNLAAFEIPERMETDYVRFPAESFVGYEPMPEDEVLEHFERNRERFASPGNGFAAGTGIALAQVRPQVEESLRLERAGRKAAEVAANFTVELYERRITGDAPELDTLIRQFRGERAKAPVFERKAVLPRGNWTDEIVEAAFQLGTSRFASDAHIAGRFVAAAGEGEGVVGLHGAGVFAVEELVVGLAGGEELHAFEVEGEAVDRLHPQRGVDGVVVLVLDPAGELAVERIQRSQVELARQEVLAHGAEEPLDLVFMSGASGKMPYTASCALSAQVTS